MKNLSATLAIVWRLAVPYFRSEDKWAGRGLLAAVIGRALMRSPPVLASKRTS